MPSPYTEPEFVIVEHPEQTLVEVVTAPPGPPGADGPSVHFATSPPTGDDGDVGDFWVVVAN